MTPPALPPLGGSYVPATQVVLAVDGCQRPARRQARRSRPAWVPAWRAPASSAALASGRRRRAPAANRPAPRTTASAVPGDDGPLVRSPSMTCSPLVNGGGVPGVPARGTVSAAAVGTV